MGIGNGVSKEFIQTIAEEGKGKAIFIEDLANMDEKLEYLLRDSVSPFLENLTIRLPKEYVRAVAPLVKTINAVRKNEPFTIYVLLSKDFKDSVATLSCYDSVSGQDKKFDIQIRKVDAINTGNVHKIAINRMIKSILSNAYYGMDPLNDI